MYNTSSGKIRYSYVEGDASSLEANTDRILGGGLEYSGDFAAFIYENRGLITDSYSNIKITSQSRSAGFVFINQGTISNSYSMSKVAYNVAAHTPFTGTDEQGNLRNTGGTIQNCYYLFGSFAGKEKEVAVEISIANWQIESSFATFGFSKDSENPQYDVWQMKQFSSIKIPSLISANTIAQSLKNFVIS